MQLITLKEFLIQDNPSYYGTINKIVSKFRYTNDSDLDANKLVSRFEVNNTTYSVVVVPSNVKQILNVHIGSTPGKNLKLWKIKPNDFKGVLYGIIMTLESVGNLFPNYYGLAIRMPKELDISKYDFIIRNLLKRISKIIKFDFFKTEKQVEDKEQFQYLFLFRKDKATLISSVVSKYGYKMTDESIGQFIESTIKDKRYTNTTNLSDKPSNDSRLKDSVPLEEITKLLEPTNILIEKIEKTQEEIDIELAKQLILNWDVGSNGEEYHKSFIRFFDHELVKGNNLLEKLKYIDDNFTEKETAIVFDAKRVDKILTAGLSNSKKQSLKYNSEFHGVKHIAPMISTEANFKRLGYDSLGSFIVSLGDYYSEDTLKENGFDFIKKTNYHHGKILVSDLEKAKIFLSEETKLFLFNREIVVDINSYFNIYKGSEFVKYYDNQIIRFSDIVQTTTRLDAKKGLGDETPKQALVNFQKYSNEKDIDALETEFSKRKIKYLNSVMSYTGSGYESINSYLRNKYKKTFLNDNTVSAYQLEDENDEWRMSKIKKMMLSVFESETELEEDLYVYRAFVPRNIEETVNKEVIVDPGFLSTSLEYDFASSWAPTGILMKIKVPKGSNVIPILSRSEHGHEREIILPPLSVLKITKIFMIGSRFHIECEYIGNGMEHYHNELEKEGIFKNTGSHLTENLNKPKKDEEKKKTKKFVDGFDDHKVSEKMIDMLKKKQIKLKK